MAAALSRTVFDKFLCVVDNCNWTGHECDLLVVASKLRVIDVEIKISRADLKKDRDKDKWFAYVGTWPDSKRQRVEWPRCTWKHYYALPADLWKPELLELCNPRSGVLVVTANGHNPKFWRVDHIKRAQPRKDNKPLEPAAVAGIARLASLRMWDAYAAVDLLR